MKKQIALIIISVLASLSVSAQNVKENEVCKIHERKPICEMGAGVIQPDLECLFENCPVIPEQKPDIPGEDISQLPEADTPNLPNIEVEPEIPEVPDFPPIPELPETPEIPEMPDTEIETPDNSYAVQVLNLVNAERAKSGLDALKYDSLLTSAAGTRAVEIKSLFSHTRPDGRSCFTVLDEINYSYRKAGENIAYGQQSPEEVMTAWMNSDGHRANILGDYDYIGIGVYEKGGVIYWSQIFASRQSGEAPQQTYGQYS